MKAGQKYTSSIQETGSQAMDTSAFQDDLDKLSQSLSSMADVSDGFDASRFMSIYVENLQTIGRLMTSSMRLSLMSGAIRQQLEFGNTLYQMNSNYLQTVVDSCMVSGQRVFLPARV